MTLRTMTAAWIATGLLISASPAAAACGSCTSHEKTMVSIPTRNIVETASAAGSFQTLLAAAKAAGLAETLAGKGPFTVLAPTDAAFAKLPEGTIPALLADLPRLRAILKHHVVAGKAMSADVAGMKKVKSLLGQKLAVNTKDGVRIGGARVVTADIECTNGVVHVIDTVLLPEADIVDIATKAGSFKTLLAAAKAAGLVDALRGAGPITVLAPTDEAFKALPEGTVEALLADKKKLTMVLTYHVLPGKWTAKKLSKVRQVKTLEGTDVPVSPREVDGRSTLGFHGATVVKADVAAANGTIHVIDRVIVPPQCVVSTD